MGSRSVIGQCSSCDNTISIRKGRDHSGLCKSCSRKSRPYEALFNCIVSSHRQVLVELTYDEFIKFTEIKNCHYCLDKIPWRPYQKVNKTFKSKAYFLDRKDNQGNYSTGNCVVCCTRCNMSRSNRFTYQEWFEMTRYFRRDYEI